MCMTVHARFARSLDWKCPKMQENVKMRGVVEVDDPMMAGVDGIGIYGDGGEGDRSGPRP